jgi:hypothetical protein
MGVCMISTERVNRFLNWILRRMATWSPSQNLDSGGVFRCNGGCMYVQYRGRGWGGGGGEVFVYFSHVFSRDLGENDFPSCLLKQPAGAEAKYMYNI